MRIGFKIPKNKRLRGSLVLVLSIAMLGCFNPLLHAQQTTTHVYQDGRHLGTVNSGTDFAGRDYVSVYGDTGNAFAPGGSMQEANPYVLVAVGVFVGGYWACNQISNWWNGKNEDWFKPQQQRR